MTHTIRVAMLGGLSVWVDDQQILDSSAKVNKPWQVFCFLMLNRDKPTSPTRLLSAIWPDDEDLADPNNVLKNTVYALRRELKNPDDPAAPGPILFENGGYLCNPAFAYQLDAEQLEQQFNRAKTMSGEEKIQLLTQCTELYKGELLPTLENEPWVMSLSLYYKKLYTECVETLCGVLAGEGRYNEMLAVATGASKIDPLEEGFYTYIFRALFALGMHRQIIPTYHKTARIFNEELGTGLSEEITEIYQAASEQVDAIEQDIMIIKDELREISHEDRPPGGPLYCTYDVFKYLYQMVARSSERSGSSIVILLLTLQSPGEAPLPSKVLSAAMNQIKTLVLGGLLRRSDTVARYSKTQYIMMLSIDRPDGTQSAIQRIRKKCEPVLQPHGIEMVVAATEMEYT